MDLAETPQGKVALAFARAMVAGDFALAHEMLSPELARECSAAELAAAYSAMVASAEGPPWLVEVMGKLDDWADRRAEDVGWAYVAIAGVGFSEAIAVVVASRGEKPLIREIEWGRP